MLFRLTVVAAALGAAGLALAAAPIKYEITEIGRFCATDSTVNCGRFSYVYGINDAGQIAGYSELPLVTDDITREVHAFRWANGILTDLGTLGASGNNDVSYGYAINNSGEVVGRSTAVVGISGTTETVEEHAFRAPDGIAPIDLGELAVDTILVSAADIAENGDIVGYVSGLVDPDSTIFRTRGFYWSATNLTMVAIPALETGGASYLRAINSDAGLAVGYAVKALLNQAIAIDLADPTVLIELGTLGGVISEAKDVNAAGVVVGQSYITSNAGIEGFVYDPNQTPKMRGIGFLDPMMRFSKANAINAVGDVVGVAQIGSLPTVYAATVFASADPAATLVDLNTRIDCPADVAARWSLNEAIGINASGQIIGYGNKGGEVRAFLLTPSTDTAPPVQCPPLEGEFENQNGGGAFGWLALPLLMVLRRFRARPQNR